MLSAQVLEIGSSSAHENAERGADRSSGAPAVDAEPALTLIQYELPLEAAHDEAEELRQPKVPLAVAAMMGMLIIALLVSTCGKQDDGDRRSRPIPPSATAQQ